jgi:hypothetical protein
MYSYISNNNNKQEYMKNHKKKSLINVLLTRCPAASKFPASKIIQM